MVHGEKNTVTVIDNDSVGARKTARKSGRPLFCIGIGVAALIALGLGSAYIFASIFNGIANGRDLHPVKDVVDESKVARPLIDAEQFFDIAATVWIVKNEHEEHAYEDEDQGIDGMKPVINALPPSKPLFSDIVFRNLRLRDKNVYATVNFTLPTAYFRQSDLNAYDLRGSIAVIPTSPSPLDRIVDYSTWIPRFIDTYPVRSWPFPMGSSGSKNKSVADRAIDSFGVTVPLLQFHNVRKKCETDVEYIDDYGDDELRDNTKHRSPVSHHPYVVTRTQIRMVDETAPFDRRWYLKKHQLLMRRSCNQQAGLFPSVHECDRSYIQVGHVETAMNLKSSESEGENEVAYSPYISLSRRVGPKDLFPIPINRQICASPEEYAQASADDQDSVEISWNLAFSGRTFRKFVYLEEIEKYNGQEIYDMELSDHHLALAHDDVEFGEGLWGHNHREGFHPRRRFALHGLGLTFAISNLVLDLLYWYTRTTTVGISTLGSFLFAGSKAVEVLVPQLAPGVEGIFGWLQLIFSPGLPLLPVVFLIKRICHIRRLGPSAGSRWARWILYPTPLTYDERASQRIENQMSYWSKGCIVLTVFVLYYKLSPQSLVVVPAELPHEQPDDYLHNWFIDNCLYLSYSMGTASYLFQFWMNRQCKSFAGSFKITGFVILCHQLAVMGEAAPWIVGSYGARRHLVAQEFVGLALSFLTIVQSIIYPSVQQTPLTIHTE